MTVPQPEPTEAPRGYSFLHLSDIHFGQEKGGELFYNNQIKKDLVSYLKALTEARKAAKRPVIDAILVTGDIAFSGKKSQYDDARAWLDDIAEAIGIARTEVRVVPGNHDVDRDAISPGVHTMIDKIIEKGQPSLNAYMENEDDRERLYARFAEYRVFAAGYGCHLDREGGDAGSKDLPLANGLNLRFIGMNSALVCRGRQEDQEPGKLFLGLKQQAVARDAGVEQIILMHHPVSWLADGVPAWRRFKNRARIFVSGHEHKPDLEVVEVKGNGKVLRIDSGAIVPAPGEEGYGYTFNIIDIVLEPSNDALKVTVEGHAWDEELAYFRADTDRFGGTHEHSAVLPCPRFAEVCPHGKTTAPVEAEQLEPADTAGEAGMIERTGVQPNEQAHSQFAELRLKFFHELTARQRIEVLIKLDLLPAAWDGSMTPGIELAALDALAAMARIKDLQEAIESISGGQTNGA